MVRPSALTTTSEVPIANSSGMAVARIRPGTIRKPPPMPKKPAASPVPSPMGTSRGSSVRALWRFSRTSGAQAAVRLRSIVSPTPIISRPNRTSSLSPSTALPSSAPPAAPAIPASAKTEAQRHFTRPARAWPARLVRALMLTATAAVPMAAWVDWTPTT